MTKQLITLTSNVKKTPEQMADALIAAVDKFREGEGGALTWR